jgi:hypothetical protein
LFHFDKGFAVNKIALIQAYSLRREYGYQKRHRSVGCSEAKVKGKIITFAAQLNPLWQL